MSWYICLIIAWAAIITAAVLGIVFFKIKKNRNKVFDPGKIFFVGVIVASISLFIPIYFYAFAENDCSPFETVAIAIHNVIRLFVVDGEFSFVTDNLIGAPDVLVPYYSITFSILFVVAPILTFRFIMTFFKSLFAHIRLMFGYNKELFVFSELNDKSLVLAESIAANRKKEKRKHLIVFNDVIEKPEEQNFELVEKAKLLGSVLFKEDIIVVDYMFHSKHKHINFFTIGSDQSENLDQSLKLIERYNERKNTNLYVFSTLPESEILISSSLETLYKENDDVGIHVHRINEVRSLISRMLYETGYESIFKSAVEDENGLKHINALVLGMGLHGTEMTKALSWFCQMTGYRPEINSFDEDPNAEEIFASLCPELMDPKLNGNYDIPGETANKITIHSGINVNTKSFDDLLRSLPDATYIFVALGNDELNISVATKLRSLCLRYGYKPVIQTVVYNTSKKEALLNAGNFKNMKYDIDFTGDMKTSYSENVILNSEIEALALARHLKWGKELDFWLYDYNYKSSIASAIHHEMKVLCHVPGADLAPDQRDPADRDALRILEHQRWDAYMRSEGYVYSGSTDKSTRNDLAKVHHCLVPFDELDEVEKAKDDD